MNIINEHGHYTVYNNRKEFILSADSYHEAIESLKEIFKEDHQNGLTTEDIARQYGIPVSDIRRI